MKSNIEIHRHRAQRNDSESEIRDQDVDEMSAGETLQHAQKTDQHTRIAEMHRYSKHALNSTAMLFAVNALFLCMSGYMTSWTRFNVASWYGFTTPNLHLQRVSGIMLFLAALLNFFASRNEHLVKMAIVHDVIIFAFYILESVYFKSIRMETLLIFGIFIAANLFWGFREVVSHGMFRQERKQRIEEEQRSRADRKSVV